MRAGTAAILVAASAAFVGVALAAGPAVYTVKGPDSEKSAWPTPGANDTWGGGAGSVNHTYHGAGPNPEKTTYTWKMPSGIPAEGAKGSLTINAVAGSESWAPGFSVSGVLVGCSGITNTPSYGTGCADGDHAAVGVSLQPGESKTVTQEFLIKPGIGTVTVVIPGYAAQFVYTSKAGAVPSHPKVNVSYVFRGTFTRPEDSKTKLLRVEIGATGSFELGTYLKGNQAPAYVPHGSAVVELHEAGASHTVELTAIATTYLGATATRRTGVQVTYKVKSSTSRCLPVGTRMTIRAEEGKAGDTIGFSVCGQYSVGYTHRTQTVAIKTGG